MNTNNDKNLLSLIDTRSLVDKVESHLIEYFVSKNLKPGDPIPKEVELAEGMGVSRTVIRESLTRLKSAGIIESKKHKGTVINSPDLIALFQKSMIPNILDSGTLKDIFELRLVLEIGMADLIFNRITEHDIEELYEIVGNEPDISDNILFDVEHEIKFHGKLYEITGNQTLTQFQTLLLPVFNYVYSSGLINRPVGKIKYVSHKGLVDVLKEGTPDNFRLAMRNHLENHFKRILERTFE